VYSFGVMILELITGKRPTDVLFQEGLTLHDWVGRHHPHDFAAVVAHSWLTSPAAQVVDEMVVDETVGADDIVAELIDLGLACTQQSPLARPTMVEVCHEITLIGEDLGKRGCAAPSVAMTVSDGSCSTMDSSF
jgi:hypothetical protein